MGAAGRLYITDRDGTTLVISHADTPRILALNQLNDSFSVAGRELFLRGRQFLYCRAEGYCGMKARPLPDRILFILFIPSKNRAPDISQDSRNWKSLPFPT